MLKVFLRVQAPRLNYWRGESRDIKVEQIKDYLRNEVRFIRDPEEILMQAVIVCLSVTRAICEDGIPKEILFKERKKELEKLESIPDEPREFLREPAELESIASLSQGLPSRTSKERAVTKKPRARKPRARVVPEKPRTSRLAIASLVCSILGFFIPFFILAMLGIIFGAKAISQIKKSRGELRGNGKAIAGLVCGIIALITNVLFWYYAVP